MGTEFNARLDYNLAKGLDVGVIGAYVIIGDFFKDAAGQTPDDRWAGYRPHQLRVLGEAGTESSPTAPGGNPGGFFFLTD